MMSQPAAIHARVLEAVHEIAPTCAVVFDDRAGRHIRFRIDAPGGLILTVAHPHFEPSEIEDWSGEKLNWVIHFLAPAL